MRNLAACSSLMSNFRLSLGFGARFQSTILVGLLAVGFSHAAANAQVVQTVRPPAPVAVTRTSALVAPRPSEARRPSGSVPLSFADFPGRWIGKAKLRYASGGHDILDCRITYFRRKLMQLQQTIRCKSDNLKLEIKTRLVDRQGQISGDWKDRVYNFGGRISGQIVGNEIRALISGRSMIAGLKLILDGNKHTIELKPRNSMIHSMHIRLARG